MKRLFCFLLAALLFRGLIKIDHQRAGQGKTPWLTFRKETHARQFTRLFTTPYSDVSVKSLMLHVSHDEFGSGGYQEYNQEISTNPKIPVIASFFLLFFVFLYRRQIFNRTNP
jgi:hypothetical protein